MRKFTKPQSVVKIIHLFCPKCTSRQRKIFLPEALLHLADRAANLTLQVTGKIFEFIELAHQFSLYDPPQRFNSQLLPVQFPIESTYHSRAALQ